MVDFAKLLSQTPAERLAATNEREAHWAELESNLIARRREQAQLMEALPGLTTWERDFTADMASLGNQHDPISNRVGGKLLYLSDRQLQSFTQLAERCVSRRCHTEAAEK